MKILLVSATKNEIAPLLSKFSKAVSQGRVARYRFRKHSIDVLVTGPGMTATAFHLGKTLNKSYDLAINAGIAGSFRKNIPVGSVVNVISDRFSDFGAEDGTAFLTAEQLKLVKRSTFNARGFSKANTRGLKKVNGITVNTVHGNETSIQKVVRKFNPDAESMEGAAFFMACSFENVPCLQIRSISNFVERRNKKKWNTGLAIHNLCNSLETILAGL